MKFYVMGTERHIAEAGRGTSKRAIKKLQEQEWVRKQGGDMPHSRINRGKSYLLRPAKGEG